MNILLCIGGASGSIYGIRLLEELLKTDSEVHLIASDGAKKIIAHETDYTFNELKNKANFYYDDSNLFAGPASGSFKLDAMVVVPCSMKTLSAIANGYGDTLTSRAASCFLKEERKLILVIRETPLDLPGIKNIVNPIPDACLNINDSNRFECRPTLLKHENNGKCVFTSKIPKNDIRLIPSAHAEGKLMFPLDKQEKYLKILEDNDQIVFRYVDPEGNYAGYPWNPNGSISNIAGICNYIGNVFGMMPHPERTFYRHQHSNWTRYGLDNNFGDGKAVFESVLEYICKRF